MADNPLSVRVSEETLGLFKEIADKSDVKNKGELLGHIITQYAIAKTKENVSILAPATEAIQELMHRINEVLVGTGTNITVMQDKYKRELEEKSKSYEETRILLQQRISLLEQERQEENERIQILINENEDDEKKVQELLSKSKQLEDSINDKKSIIEEYKQKNDTLNSIVNEYKSAFDENKKLKQEISQSNQEKEKQLYQIESLTKKTIDMETQQVHLLNQQKEQMNLEQQKETLKLKQELQNKLELQQDKQMKIINEYEIKVQDLLKKLENDKIIPNKKVVSKNEEKTKKTTL